MNRIRIVCKLKFKDSVFQKMDKNLVLLNMQTLCRIL